ncbi:MAG: hypothetical protein A3H63_00780 [Candidatus Harrisonbacteria bacterium RIFCSPLOWO2_02_FULL_45_10c]|uniref:Uncharacterized protein n=1 Tax=Candidatus Harrisonbacteria bacterium RIFCSPLOWO2_02_FULL_45_10c TaxID=1798410 RepID=A0A1G1ZWM9_9BACT|nr:MAG: hypothetical protein A3H63_00780 [Candidatus Harrisonbacteria bacterium RIFCSPLOWO2_02_FULL_45_10c]
MTENPSQVQALIEKLSAEVGSPDPDAALLFFLRNIRKYFLRCYSYRPPMAKVVQQLGGDYVTTVHRLKNSNRAIDISLAISWEKHFLLKKKSYILNITEFNLAASAGWPEINYQKLKYGRYYQSRHLFATVYSRYALPLILRLFIELCQENNKKKRQRNEIFEQLGLIESLMYNQLQNPNLNFIE